MALPEMNARNEFGAGDGRMPSPACETQRSGATGWMLQRLGAISPGQQRALLVLLCALLFCTWLYRTPITEVDEVRYVQATREMMAQGQFIVPYYNTHLRSDKPILTYLIIAAGLLAGQGNEAVIRLPFALLALLQVLVFHGFLLWLFKRIGGAWPPSWQQAARGAAFSGAVAFAAMPLFAPWSRVAVTDMVLTCFSTLTFLALVRAMLEPQLARWWYLASALTLGLAFLTKGPVGLIFPMATWVIFYASRHRLICEARRVPWLAGIALFCVVNCWYFLAWRADPQYLTSFFITHNFERFVGTSTSTMTIGKYLMEGLIIVLVGFAAIFPAGILLLRDLRHPFSGSRRLYDIQLLVDLRRFCLIWITVVLAINLVSEYKSLTYLQSITPIVALLFSLHLSGRFSPEEERTAPPTWLATAEKVSISVFGVGLCGIPFVSLLFGAPHLRPWEERYPSLDTAVQLGIFAVLAGLVLIVLFVNKSGRQDERLWMWLQGISVAVTCVLVVGFLPLRYTCAYRPDARLGAYLAGYERAVPLTTYFACAPGKRRPENPENLTFYARRPVDLFIDPGKVSAFQEMLNYWKHYPGGTFVLVTNREGMAQLCDYLQMRVVKEEPYFIVVRVTGMK